MHICVTVHATDTINIIITRAYIKCKRASLRSRAHNDILLDVNSACMYNNPIIIMAHGHNGNNSKYRSRVAFVRQS